jgi:pyruvate dehydrogenase E1 component alpha subunit
MKAKNRVSTVFFGDGAADEGVLYESLNFAMLKKLPVVYVLENNQWSVCSHVSARKAGDNIFHQADPQLLLTRKIYGNNVLTVYKTACEAVQRARQGFGPSFIECETYRILGHAGCESQDPKGYRDRKEVEAWKNKCPVGSFQNTLLSEKVLTPDGLVAMENKIAVEIDEAFAFAQESPLPEGEDLQKNLYCE